MIVAGTGCEACRGEVSEWVALARELRNQSGLAWLLVTMDSPDVFERLVSVLDEQGHSFSVFTMKDSVVFALGTGVVSTPTLVGLDATNSALFVVRHLTPPARAALLAVIRERSGGG
jgi:hypothetical protein